MAFYVQLFGLFMLPVVSLVMCYGLISLGSPLLRPFIANSCER